MATREAKRRTFALAVLAVGALVAALGVGAALGYQDVASGRTAPAATESHTESGGLVANVDLRLQALDVEVERGLALDQAGLDALPLPGFTVRPEAPATGLDAPVDVDLGIDVTIGSHAKRTSTTDGNAQVQTMQVMRAHGGAEAATLVAAAFAGAGLLAYFWASLKTWSFKFFILPLMPLYAHVTRAEVFENEVRERIFATIRDAPGVSASELSRATGVSWGTTIYHLEVLEQTRMVTSMRDGRYRRYFQNGAALDTDKKVVSLLRNPMTAQVAQTVRAAPGATQKELAQALAMSPQALHWHLARLVKAGLVEKQRDGRMVRHFVAA